eukprot:scaffold136168_cov32-Tisochrysis_lutea.AAC.5
MAGAAVGKVIAIDRGEHNIVNAPLHDGSGSVERLIRIRRRGSRVGVDGAELAATGARVAEEHYGSRSPVPALADVGALRLLAHGVELELRERRLELVEARVVSTGRGDAEPVGARGGHGRSDARDQPFFRHHRQPRLPHRTRARGEQHAREGAARAHHPAPLAELTSLTLTKGGRAKGFLLVVEP